MKKTTPVPNANRTACLPYSILTLIWALAGISAIFRGVLIAGIIIASVFGGLSILLLCLFLKLPKTKEVKISTLSKNEAIRREGAFKYDKRRGNKVSVAVSIGALLWAAVMLVSIIAIIAIGNFVSEKAADILLYCWVGYCGAGIITMLALIPYVNKKLIEAKKK